jgi:hypothetical protein
VALQFRTGGSRHTGTAAPPHRYIQVTLQDKDKKLFEVYFEPNKSEQYVFNKGSFIKE